MFKEAWAGRIFGTNTGNIFVEYTQTDDKLIGLARFHDDKFGISVSDISGSIVEGKLKIKAVPKIKPEGTIVGEATIEADLKQDGTLVGRWETTIGTGGTLKLYPHGSEKVSKNNEPDQVYSKVISIGSIRLFKKDIKQLFDVIEKDFAEGKLVVTYVQRSSEVTRYAPDFLKLVDTLKEIKSLKIFIQEQEVPGINKMVNVDLFETTGNAIRVSGISESWVVGKAESIHKEISNNLSWVVTKYKKHGLNFNLLIFFIMLVLIPEITSWQKRIVFVFGIYVLLLVLYYVHEKLIPNTMIVLNDKQPNIISRSWPSIVSWLFAIVASLIAAYLFNYLQTKN